MAIRTETSNCWSSVEDINN